MSALVKGNYLTASQYEEGLAEILKFAGDFVVDMPKFWEYVAELVCKCPHLVISNVLSLSFLLQVPC